MEQEVLGSGAYLKRTSSLHAVSSDINSYCRITRNLSSTNAYRKRRNLVLLRGSW
eukprot:CAMPEP_0205875672 /NCGR_PEP_ID=MMETSP1083-20121108/13383_1 /ASSEMBLY_ACC=CAM_ASM_000430 /TAXON_ID=97485 /ORGANISM="Prymnesium parvum, Strain Texoma1" /LENGTH=54 /DNA_ID=CAMNT_0053238369 /DNA_START=72 /DNA_END=236 /DNA_ORIENTATION=+